MLLDLLPLARACECQGVIKSQVKSRQKRLLSNATTQSSMDSTIWHRLFTIFFMSLHVLLLNKNWVIKTQFFAIFRAVKIFDMNCNTICLPVYWMLNYNTSKIYWYLKKKNRSTEAYRHMARCKGTSSTIRTELVIPAASTAKGS